LRMTHCRSSPQAQATRQRSPPYICHDCVLRRRRWTRPVGRIAARRRTCAPCPCSFKFLTIL
jgi:hypothetical protein